MHRFFSDDERTDGEREFLSPEDARHACSVLRLREGDTVEMISRNALWLAKILSVSGTDVCLERLSPLPSTEPALSLTLFQGLPKAEKMDWIVQKATEIGVCRIVPVLMERCIVRLSPQDSERKTSRWQKIAREACKQSGRCCVPEVVSPVPLRDLTPFVQQPEKTVVPWENASSFGPRSFYALSPGLKSLGIVIGPEGGISDEEIRFLKSAQCVPVTLGKRILRTETAGLAAAAAFMSLYGEME